MHAPMLVLSDIKPAGYKVMKTLQIVLVMLLMLAILFCAAFAPLVITYAVVWAAAISIVVYCVIIDMQVNKAISK